MTTSVHYTERLASGLGGVAISERTVSTGNKMVATTSLKRQVTSASSY
ncbi:MAG: hypothetical protein R2855_13985 [Thermomicrobiales bacterium]